MKSGNNTAWKRKLFVFSRLIHIYVSTLLFGLVLFFSVTGVTLNHRWYGESVESEILEVALTSETISLWSIPANAWNPNVNAIQHYLKTEYGFPSAYSIDLDKELGEIMLEFKMPAGFASVLISVPDELLSVEYEAGSALGVLNDLHKGRHSGSVWFWLIDISAALICVFAITGLIIVFQGRKNRSEALVMASLGSLSPLILYLAFVPKAGL